ncbi:hypothetical protein [Fluviicola sp.]|uniref:hypothetical protein n=1 Tax=Fluviicola sp. TaxID=1917219 RepID=UPI0031E184D0
MKSLYLLLCLSAGISGNLFAQTNYSTIASNRIIQKHHLPATVAKIAQIDPARLQVLWNYFSNSFSFSAPESNFTIEELLNIQHFDVSEYEHLRQDNAPVQFIFRGSIHITLKSGQELNALLQGYDLDALLHELPLRPFPEWTAVNFTESDFENYKKQVWDWARDYPEAYLELTADTNRMHIRFHEWQNLEDTRRTQILNGMNYLIID